MARLLFLVIVLIFSGIVFLIKKGASIVTGRDVNFKDESAKVYQKTAGGIKWMNDQWENAKVNAGMISRNNSTSAVFDGLSATEIIFKVKANKNYETEDSESIYIQQAVVKMNNRQYDDALKLVMQLDEGDARDFIVKEIEQKRNG